MLRPVLNTLWSFGGWGVSLTRPVLESVRRVRSLSYLSFTGICLVVRQVGTFSCTPRPGIYLVVHLFDSLPGGGSLLHAPCWDLSYTPCLGICLVVRREESYLTRPVLQSVSSLRGPGVSLTHSVLESILSFVEWGVSLTSPVLVCVSSSVGGEFLLHAP